MAAKPAIQTSAGILHRSEQKRKMLRRLVRGFSRFFQRPVSSRTDGGKAGPFLPRRGLTMLPDGNVVKGWHRSAHDADLLSGDFEIEATQEHYLSAGEWSEMDGDCRELLNAINEARWDDCEAQMSVLYGRIEDITIGERATRKSYDTLFEQFEAALDYIQSVEFNPFWLPSTPELLTAEEFTFVDKKIAEGLARNPQRLFSVDPRFFEELIASIYADLGYRVILTQRTRDGGRDIIALAHKDHVDLKFIIECKRYAPHRKISVAQVRSLYGVAQDERVTKALLATTSGFTTSAQEFARPHIWELELLDFDKLIRMIWNYASPKNR